MAKAKGPRVSLALERMKRKVVAGLLAIVVVISGWIAYQRGWGNSDVTAVVSNNASESLHTFTVLVETCGEKRSVVGGPLSPGETRRFQYPVCGEGGYTIEAQLESGKIVKGGGGYVENGYVTSDKISDQSVASAQETY
jgi:hypothetical protein